MASQSNCTSLQLKSKLLNKLNMASINCQEYFAKKRFLQKVESASFEPSRGKCMSQDLLALQTISKTYECRNNEESKTSQNNGIKVRMVDLSKFSCASKTPKEIDLGPISPLKQTSLDDRKLPSCFVIIYGDLRLKNSSVLKPERNLKWTNIPRERGNSESSNDVTKSTFPFSEKVKQSIEPLKETSLGEQLSQSQLKNCKKFTDDNSFTRDRLTSGDYAAPDASTEDRAIPTFTGSTYGQETPFNPYRRPPSESRVTFSNIINTRTLTPSSLEEPTVFAKPFMRGNSLDPHTKNPSSHKPIWEQDNSSLLKSDEDVTHNTRAIDQWYALPSQNVDIKTQSRALVGKDCMQRSSWDCIQLGLDGDFSRKRSSAYLHEDFQDSPLKKYITKEEYQLKKRKEKQKKQMKKEKQRIVQDKQETQRKLEDIKNQKLVWSILDDSFYNKVEPCGNKDAAQQHTEKNSLPDGYIDSFIDDAEFNKAVTKQKENIPGKEEMDNKRKEKDRLSIENEEPFINSRDYTKQLNLEILDDVHYNKTKQCGQSETAGHQEILGLDSDICDTQSRVVVAEPVRFERNSPGNASTAKRMLNKSEPLKTPPNVKKISSFLRNSPAMQTARHIGWLEFMTGRSTKMQSSGHNNKKSLVSFEGESPLTINMDKNHLEETVDEVLCLEHQLQPQTAADVLEEEGNAFNPEVDLVEPELAEEGSLNEVNNNTLNKLKENVLESPTVLTARKLLHELLDVVCKEKKAYISAELPETSIESDRSEEFCSKADKKEIQTNTDVLQLDIETQTVEFKLDKPKIAATKDTACECHLLKDWPITINRFTQTNFEECKPVESIGTQTSQSDLNGHITAENCKDLDFKEYESTCELPEETKQGRSKAKLPTSDICRKIKEKGKAKLGEIVNETESIDSLHTGHSGTGQNYKNESINAPHYETERTKGPKHNEAKSIDISHVIHSTSGHENQNETQGITNTDHGRSARGNKTDGIDISQVDPVKIDQYIELKHMGLPPFDQVTSNPDIHPQIIQVTFSDHVKHIKENEIQNTNLPFVKYVQNNQNDGSGTSVVTKIDDVTSKDNETKNTKVNHVRNGAVSKIETIGVAHLDGVISTHNIGTISPSVTKIDHLANSGDKPSNQSLSNISSIQHVLPDIPDINGGNVKSDIAHTPAKSNEVKDPRFDKSELCQLSTAEKDGLPTGESPCIHDWLRVVVFEKLLSDVTNEKESFISSNKMDVLVTEYRNGESSRGMKTIGCKILNNEGEEIQHDKTKVNPIEELSFEENVVLSDLRICKSCDSNDNNIKPEIIPIVGIAHNNVDISERQTMTKENPVTQFSQVLFSQISDEEDSKSCDHDACDTVEVRYNLRSKHK